MLLGNITYANGDPSNILVGDIITYSCEPGTDLRGPSKRFCQRSGNWTGSDPECVGEVNTSTIIRILEHGNVSSLSELTLQAYTELCMQDLIIRKQIDGLAA